MPIFFLMCVCVCFFFFFRKGHFQYIKIKHDGESERTQTEKMNKHVYSVSLFVSSKTRYRAEFQYTESGL